MYALYAFLIPEFPDGLPGPGTRGSEAVAPAPTAELPKELPLNAMAFVSDTV